MSATTKEVLKKYNEIGLVVKGRNTGKETSRPVWFVLQQDELLLLPVEGSDTQWFRNILKNPQVRITFSGKSHTGRLEAIKDRKEVGEVIELFRRKYGEGDVKKYYTKLDVASKLKLTA